MGRIITRNPLAFPCGVRPGFNPEHRASVNRRFSGTPQGSNYINVLTGKVGNLTLSSGPISSFNHGLLGPCVQVPSYFMQQCSTFEPYPVAVSEDCTLAGFTAQTIPAGDVAMFANNGGNGNLFGNCAVRRGSNLIWAMQNVVSVGPTGQAFFPVDWNSYFYAMSWSKGNVNGVNCVSIDLSNGKIVTEFMGSSSFASLGGTGGASCLGPGNSNSMDGFFGPHMWSATYMTMPELVAWANDPWAFWYPDV